ncbi:MAG: hypothetical protein AAGK57_09575, partial [Pseudomonadota bacterium]
MSQVTRRKVLYIPGYDPFHPRRYRELYRKEGAAQAAISGYSLTQRKGDGPYSWIASADMDGVSVTSEIEVLVWSDIVSDSMSASIPATYVQLARTAWAYIGSGALFRLMRLRKGPVIAALYPIVLLLAQLVAALGLGWAAFGLIRWGIGALPLGLLGIAFGLAGGAAVAWATLSWFKTKDSKIFAYYLMHDYAFSARWGGANPPE